eukprot:4317000-Pyramimonas_sp.AAC.1
MMRTRRPPSAFFRPLTKTSHQSRRFWTAALHIISDSTCTFHGHNGHKFGAITGFLHRMREHFHGVQADVKGGALGKTLLDLARKDIWRAPAFTDQGDFVPGVYAPIQVIFWP